VFGLGAGEIAVIVIIAIILWGPEKLPDVARKAARIINFLRQVANNAQTSVRSELGPGFEDFDITDPRGSVRRYVMRQGGLDGVDDLVSTLRSASDELNDAATDMRRALDTDGNGVVDEQELAAGQAAMAGADAGGESVGGEASSDGTDPEGDGPDPGASAVDGPEAETGAGSATTTPYDPEAT